MTLLTAGVILWTIAIIVAAAGVVFLSAVVIQWAAGRIRDRHRARRRVAPPVWLRTPIDKRELEIAYLADEAEQRMGRLDQ